MYREIIQIIKSKFFLYISTIYFFILLWWVYLQISQNVGGIQAYIFNWSYGLIGLSATAYATYISKNKWNGHSSYVGKAILLIAAGLLSQWVGLQIWTYYNLFAGLEVPYPSFADVGYFGLAIFYTFSAYYIARAAGVKFFFRTAIGKIFAFLIPSITLGIAFILFLRGVGFDLTSPLKTFFDIAYPLGEILPITISLFTLSLTGKILGGSMRAKILLLLFAFAFQFVTEYLFLYFAGIEIYVNGGVNDILYATSYYTMSLALISYAYYPD